MQSTNIILGYGETLTQPFTLSRGSGDKKYPYLIAEQRVWLGEQMDSLTAQNTSIPQAARPRGESVTRFTLHPAFLAKSHHPNALFAASGLRCVGSRSSYVMPRKQTGTKHFHEPIFTAMLFVAGTDQAFDRLAALLRDPSTPKTHKQALCRLELIEPFKAEDKNLIHNTELTTARLEVVLHATKDDSDIVKAFADYVASLQGYADTSRALVVGGLTFVPVTLAVSSIDTLGLFQFVRAVRLMPSLRIGGHELRTVGDVPKSLLPSLPALDQTLRVGIFDGGIGHADLAPWVGETILPGAESTGTAYLKHGNGVTSTVLFGPIDAAAPVFNRPYANVMHYRCVSPELEAPSGVPDVDLYHVLRNIDEVLTSRKLDFVNFSLGPRMPMDDDEVHPWTALIDTHLSDGDTFATVAVGNDGNAAWPDCRVQPPSDMVNAIAVGACDTRGEKWKRATYSSYGPGRSPGLIKPDGVTFGGSDTEPFVMYNALTGQLMESLGTSFSAPFAMHTAIGVKASLTSPLNMLALRALMNHHAQRPSGINMSEVGHGRYPQRVEDVLHCADNEVRVIYQGTLTAGQNLRATIPYPTLPLGGRVTLRATLCFACHTDPEHAINYTRAGLTVYLRPKKNSKKTMGFFSASKMYTTELEARAGEQKWETTLKHEHCFNAGTLDDPMFDITYGAREDGQAVDNSTLMPLRYAMIVSIAVENTPGIYNNIRQRYQTLLPVEVRQEVRLKTNGS